MKKGFPVWCVAGLLLASLVLPDAALAKVRAPRHLHGQQEQGQQNPGAQQQQPKEIKTAYFTLSLEKGWRLLKPVQSQNGAVSVLLGAPGNKGAIAINVMKANLSAGELARNMRTNMDKDKVSLQALEEKDGIQEFGFTRGKATGRAWIGANGKEAAAVTIFGDQEAGKAVLKQLKPRDPKIFPRF